MNSGSLKLVPANAPDGRPIRDGVVPVAWSPSQPTATAAPEIAKTQQPAPAPAPLHVT